MGLNNQYLNIAFYTALVGVALDFFSHFTQIDSLFGHAGIPLPPFWYFMVKIPIIAIATYVSIWFYPSILKIFKFRPSILNISILSGTASAIYLHAYYSFIKDFVNVPQTINIEWFLIHAFMFALAYAIVLITNVYKTARLSTPIILTLLLLSGIASYMSVTTIDYLTGQPIQNTPANDSNISTYTPY